MEQDKWPDWKRAAWGLPKAPREQLPDGEERGTDVVLEHATPDDVFDWCTRKPDTHTQYQPIPNGADVVDVLEHPQLGWDDYYTWALDASGPFAVSTVRSSK